MGRKFAPRTLKAVDLVRNGVSMSEAATRTGASQNSVHRACRIHGVKSAHKRLFSGERWISPDDALSEIDERGFLDK